ncbi:MAG: penicillin-binding protein 1A [Desulfopila sp.]
MSSSASPCGTRARKPPCNEKHIIGFLFAISLLLTVFLGSLLLFLHHLAIPDLSSVANYAPPQATVIYDRHGREVERIFSENRTVIPLQAMHSLLPSAFVAAEDGRFFSHHGLDMFSVLRAAFANLRSGRKSQGGSTITQQVARALLLSPEKTYIRKFKEAILAWRIDTVLSKEDILYIYLNQIYLGEGAHGVEAAAHVYFAKNAAELDLAEMALLAGLPQAPSRYSPLNNFQLAKMRQRYVLNRMAEDGYISAEQARAAYGVEMHLVTDRRAVQAIDGYYLDVVKKEAAGRIGRPLQDAGARIYTALDQQLQRQAAQAVVNGLKATRARQALQGDGLKEMPQGALVCLEQKTGRVRAIVGGADYTLSPFNRATQARRPAGSAFKPFVYAAALESGWNAQSVISDAPLAIAGGKGRVWQPKNYSRTSHGDTRLETALAQSYNIATVRLMQKVGVRKVHAMAKSAGISATMPPDLSLALGAVDVSLMEMTAAYTPFANNGQYLQPTTIETMIVDGRQIPFGPAAPVRIMQPHSAVAMRMMLEEVILEGTGRRAGGLVGRSGGKTGTSDESRDAWFIGFNGNYLAGVWVGHDRNQSLGATESGGRTAAPIWHEFMVGVQNTR